MSTSTVSKIKNICGFCESSAGKDLMYEEVAENLGITRAKKRFIWYMVVVKLASWEKLQKLRMQVEVKF